ncbi:MAG: CbbQ/NirQ/NorQ/GpvN family protein [Thermodesulfobacteriota bacterium]|nr:CbbQ/NirQ/NorQ/GpvN family protein [Thermodesulfobacteriota bacterium]
MTHDFRETKKCSVNEFNSSWDEEPFYISLGDEIEIFESAYHNRLPVLLKGPTGCGKTRFVEHMTFRLKGGLGTESVAKHSAVLRDLTQLKLITIACHEDLTATDLVGRYLIKGNETVWIDGPLTKAVRTGAICYLDEVVEARKDTIVLIHPLTDHRRFIPMEKQGYILEAHPDFLLVISYNPGYQSVIKDLKQSTRQRFVTIEFRYPPPEMNARIIAHESGLSLEDALQLAVLSDKIYHLKKQGLEEGVSPRLLIYAGCLIKSGISPRIACRAAISNSITDDGDMSKAIEDLIDSIFP